MRRKIECPPNCGHSEAQHRAFDDGLKAGEIHGLTALNPYIRFDLKDAFEAGKSVGVLNRNKTL